MTPAERAIVAQALIERLQVTVDGQPHILVLVALLQMYRTTALRHPDCMGLAADDCMTVGLELAVRNAEQQQPPSGAPIH